VRLALAMAALRLAPSDVAKTFDVSPSKLSHWTHGRHYPASVIGMA
jgi:DNA-binding transcriptional regulator YiaG